MDETHLENKRNIIIENDIWVAVFNELYGYDGYWCGKYYGYD